VSSQEQVNLAQNEDVSTPLHERLLGSHPRIREINALIGRLAPTNLTVLITGETGTGKDIVARLLHKLSPRQKKPFIKVNCPSIPEGVLESELFGYERGAFTGAHTSRPGRFELSHEGTLFLDEICETAQHVQSKLIQVLDGEPFMRIGGTTPIYTNVRVVAATNVPLADAVEQGRLRKDVSYRLSEVVVQMPSLRERRDDITLLAEHFNYNICKMLKKDYQPLGEDLLEQLRDQEWPGNVRQLAGWVKEYVATGSSDGLAPQGPEPELTSNDGNGKRETPKALHVPERKVVPLKEAARRAVETAERALIEETLRYTLWNRREAAKLLKTSYSSLLRRIETYRIGKS
jgi:DNA-binding NtrC family response regulator